MPNIINYIEKILAKVAKGKTGPSAKGWGKVIIGGNGNRIYNKENLWIAFKRYDPDTLETDKTPGEYPLKNYNREITKLWGNS